MATAAQDARASRGFAVYATSSVVSVASGWTSPSVSRVGSVRVRPARASYSRAGSRQVHFSDSRPLRPMVPRVVEVEDEDGVSDTLIDEHRDVPTPAVGGGGARAGPRPPPVHNVTIPFDRYATPRMPGGETVQRVEAWLAGDPAGTVRTGERRQGGDELPVLQRVGQTSTTGQQTRPVGPIGATTLRTSGNHARSRRDSISTANSDASASISVATDGSLSIVRTRRSSKLGFLYLYT
jgi:hypothetical protein